MVAPILKNQVPASTGRNNCVKVRAERSGKGNARGYTIKVRAQDESGNLSVFRFGNVPSSQGH